MKVTNQTISLIKNRFRDHSKPKINQSQLAEHMQLGKAWVSKLMNRKLQNLSEKQVELLEEFLDIRLQAFVDVSNHVSPLAQQLSAKMQESAAVATIVGALLEIDTRLPSGPEWIKARDMTRIGKSIIRIALANDNKPNKVARLTLDLLRAKDPPPVATAGMSTPDVDESPGPDSEDPAH